MIKPEDVYKSVNKVLTVSGHIGNTGQSGHELCTLQHVPSVWISTDDIFSLWLR